MCKKVFSKGVPFESRNYYNKLYRKYSKKRNT